MTIARTFQLWHTKVARIDQSLNDIGGSLLALAIRCYVGWQFFKAGLVKVSDWGATLSLFQDEYHVPVLPPELAAALAATGELVLPVLLVSGIFSRPAALSLALLNVIAVISYPQLFELPCPAALNDHFYWGALLLVIVAFGPGRLSLDALIARSIKV